MLLHANAVAQNRPTGVRTGRVNRDDSHCTILLPIIPRQMINQSALARTRRASEPKDTRLPAMRKQSLQQIRPPRRAVLDGGDGARQSARVARPQLVDPCLDVLIQTVSVKQS